MPWSRKAESRYNVVSFRVTDEEADLLYALADGGSVSAVMREIFFDYLAAHIKQGGAACR